LLLDVPIFSVAVGFFFYLFLSFFLFFFLLLFFFFFLPSVGVPEGGKKLVIKEKKNINTCTPMASDPGGSRQ